jgi:GT2 family glycosyltransferase
MAPSRCSIIIPVHNKAALTRQCLESIFASPPSVGFEVVVVDDASSDSTPELLASYGKRVRTVRLEKNAGFATACNNGAAAAKGDYLVFLNNDTIAEEGWLDELARYADDHAGAAVVGSRLLFPDRTVQHAGVVFSLSGDPLHLYAGFPTEHPAVMKSRRFQAVTAACLLIRREVFSDVDGFDTDYHNDLEDVDLCLRLGALGHEVHYCHTSVLYHLESASRAFRFHEGRSAKLYRERWAAGVRSDELDYYVEDGQLDLLRYSPEKVSIDGGRRQQEAEVLQIRSRQLLTLLRETMRLASNSAGRGTNGRTRLQTGVARKAARPGVRGALRGRAAKRVSDGRVASLRAELAGPLDGYQHEEAEQAQAPVPERPRLEGYPAVIREVTEIVESAIPEGATVLVASKGDEKLLEFANREGWHFPRAEDGRYRGYYPADDEDAISHLEELRDRGADYLVLPDTAFWWLDSYPGFGRALKERYRAAVATERCRIFDLRPQHEPRAIDEQLSDSEYASLAGQMRRTVEAVVAPQETVLVVSKGDEHLVDFSNREGWHFPRAEDGRYRGYYPADDEDAISHLEELRDRGADYLVLPGTAFWWLEHYPGFAERLRERQAVVWLDSCAVFDLRAAAEAGDAASLSAAPAPEAEPSQAGARTLTEPEYGDLVERVQAFVAATVPAGTTVLVASKGDDRLLDLAGRRGWHFPRAEDGRYRGYYPETDEDAVAHLEELRSQGAQYLVFPSSSMWWLDHYAGLAGHLRNRYGTAAYDHDTAMVFELWEPLLPAVVRSLLPPGSRVAVLSRFEADLAGLEGYEAIQLSAATTDDGIEQLERYAVEGVEFLVIPRSSFTWQGDHLELAEHLQQNHRLVTHQQHAGEIWELEAGSPAGQAVEPAPVTDPGSNGDPPREPIRFTRRLSRAFRLLWKRQGVQSEDG